MENVILAVVATGYSRGSGGAVGILGTGLLLMRWSWLSIPFTATVAGVVLAIAGCAIPADESRPRFDVWGALFAATAVGLIVVAATEIPERGWFDPVSAGSTGLGAIALIAFVLVELVVPQPLLDVRVFADRGLAGGAAAVTVQYLIMFGMFPVVVQFLQLILGYRPLPSAFGVAPIMAPLVVVSPIAPWLAERTGLRAMLCAGSVVTALGMYGLSRLTVDSGYVDVLWPLLVLGLGLALSATPATAAIVSGLPAEKHGVAAAVNDATREVGGAIGIAVGGSVLAAGYSHHISALLPVLPPPLRGPGLRLPGRRPPGSGLPGPRRPPPGGGRPHRLHPRRPRELLDSVRHGPTRRSRRRGPGARTSRTAQSLSEWAVVSRATFELNRQTIPAALTPR